MLAISELEFLAPAERFGDIHVDILSRLEIDQDQSPEDRMHGGKADHQKQPARAIAGANHKPRGEPTHPRPAARTQGGGQK